jgi:hypothetical protein
MRLHDTARRSGNSKTAGRRTRWRVALALLLLLLAGCDEASSPEGPGTDTGEEQPGDPPPDEPDVIDPSGLQSDDFEGCAVDTTLWTLVDPRGDGQLTQAGAGTDEGEIRLSVPAGVEHDPWRKGDRTLRLVQRAQDADFSVEVKFESTVELAYQLQGIVVEQDANRFLRFDFYGDGASTIVFAASLDGSSATVHGNDDLGRTGAPLYLRVNRTGDEWVQLHSLDGEDWVESARFTEEIVVNEVGVFVGNESDGIDVPAHTARIDYFENRARPIDPADAPGDLGDRSLSTSVLGEGTIVANPDQTHYACGERVTLTALPDPGHDFAGWSGDLSGNANPTEVVMTEDRSVTAEFVLDGSAPSIGQVEIARGSSFAIVGWDTDEPADSFVRFGETRAYELGSAEDTSLSLNHELIVDGLDPARRYFFEIESTDDLGRTTTSGDWESGPMTGPQIRLFQGVEQAAGFGGISQPIFNLLGNVADADGVGSLVYSLNGAREEPLVLGPDTYRLHLPGDFNAEIPYTSLDEGVNTILLRAIDGEGNESVEIVTVDGAMNVTPVPDFAIDFSSLDSIQEVAAVVDGDWGLFEDGLRVNSMAYDRLIAIGDLGWTDYEATATLTIHEVEPFFEPPSHGAALGFVTRWPGHTPDGRTPTRQWWPFGSFAHLRWRGEGSTFTSQNFTLQADRSRVLDTRSGSHIQVGVVYSMRVSVETRPDGSTLHRLKMWVAADPEPAEWDVEGFEDGDDDLSAGSLLLVAHHVDVTFHSLVVAPVAP